jgi:flagellar biosynthesis/type III secretory pathway ATPase
MVNGFLKRLKEKIGKVANGTIINLYLVLNVIHLIIIKVPIALIAERGWKVREYE